MSIVIATLSRTKAMYATTMLTAAKIAAPMSHARQPVMTIVFPCRSMTIMVPYVNRRRRFRPASPPTRRFRFGGRRPFSASLQGFHQIGDVAALKLLDLARDDLMALQLSCTSSLSAVP
jgi:hypothetical protein